MIKKGIITLILALACTGAIAQTPMVEGDASVAVASLTTTYTIPATMTLNDRVPSQLKLSSVIGILSASAADASIVSVKKVKIQTVSGSLVTNDIIFASGTIASNGTALAISVTNDLPLSAGDQIKFVRDANSTNAVLYVSPAFDWIEL